MTLDARSILSTGEAQDTIAVRRCEQGLVPIAVAVPKDEIERADLVVFGQSRNRRTFAGGALIRNVFANPIQASGQG